MKFANMPLVTPFDPYSEQEAEPILLHVLLDRSGSTDKIKDDLAQSFNEAFIGSLRNVNNIDRPMLRVAASAFSEDFLPLWYGFRSLEELGANPLNPSLLSMPGLGGRTMLFGASLKAFGRTVQAADELARNREINKWTYIKLLVFSDGANNEEPSDPAEVRKAFDWQQPLVETEKLLFYFQTEWGLNKIKFGRQAAECGFDKTFFFDEHSLDTDSLKRELRRAMYLISDEGCANAPRSRKVRAFTPNEMKNWVE